MCTTLLRPRRKKNVYHCYCWISNFRELVTGKMQFHGVHHLRFWKIFALKKNAGQETWSKNDVWDDKDLWLELRDAPVSIFWHFIDKMIKRNKKQINGKWKYFQFQSHCFFYYCMSCVLFLRWHNLVMLSCLSALYLYIPFSFVASLSAAYHFLSFHLLISKSRLPLSSSLADSCSAHLW